MTVTDQLVSEAAVDKLRAFSAVKSSILVVANHISGKRLAPQPQGSLVCIEIATSWSDEWKLLPLPICRWSFGKLFMCCKCRPKIYSYWYCKSENLENAMLYSHCIILELKIDTVLRRFMQPLSSKTTTVFQEFIGRSGEISWFSYIPSFYRKYTFKCCCFKRCNM